MLDPRDTTQATRTTQAGPRAPAPPGKARAGAPFGPYDLQDELGRGGMGAVFRARERATGRVVAVKVVLGEVEPEGLERFRREGQIAGSLDHPGIVRVHSAGVVDGTPYLACELVEGARSLVAAAAALPPLERARLVRDAARALGHAHARGVVHRDVKPDNLLVDALGRVRVTDFGVAAARGLERLTATGQLVGTPAYMAPEQLDGDRSRLGPWTDVWALGAVLHEALTGRRPFDGPSLPALFRQILTGVPRPVHELAPGTPPALADVVARAMAKAFEARYAHADALADDLERVLAARRTEAAEAEAARRARRALRGLALGAGAVALLGAAVVAAARPAAPVAPPPPRVDWVALAAEREAAGDLPGAIAALGSALAAADAEPEALRARRGALELRALRERAEARARTGDLDGALADREALVRAGDPEERVLEVLAARVERRLEAPRLSRVAARALLADVERLLPAGGRRAERAIGARGVARWALRALDIDDDAARAARADLDRALRVADEPRLRLERARTWVATRDSGAMAEDLDRARGPFDLRLAASLATLRADVTIALGRLELAEDEQARPLGALAEGSVVRGRARLRAAVEELDQVLRQEESPLAHLLRAQARRLLADGGRLTAAEAQAVEADELAALEGAAALEATSPGPLADLLERHGRPGALELLERAASDPTDASLLLRLQAQRRRAGDLQRALADLDRLVQRFPDQLQPRVERLGCRGAAGDPVGALEDLDALLALAPDPGAVRTSTDDVAALLGRLRDDLAARGPDAARRASYGDVFLAHEALRRSDLDTAVSALQRALQRSPDLAPASALLADALPRRARSRLVDGDLAGAAADAEAADAQAAASGADVHVRVAGLKLRAEVALLSSDVPAAAARFEEALGLAPASPDLLAARACMRGLLGDCAGAAEGFAAAARAASKAEDERRFASEAALHRAVARDLPGEEGRAARAALFRGVWLDGHKRSADALAAYDECVRLAPRLAQARARRGRARLAAGQGALALEDLTAWVELEPASGHALAERATARLRLGDRAGALTDFERSLEVEPGHPRADVARREVTRLRRALGR